MCLIRSKKLHREKREQRENENFNIQIESGA